MSELVNQTPTTQRKESASTGGGQSMAPPAFSLSAAPPIQRSANTPRGREICTDFGDYYVVPDNTHQCYAGVTGEQITESEFAQLRADWESILNNSGSLQIAEDSRLGVAHPGFRARVLPMFARLLSRPTGRRLLHDLIVGAHLVKIVPSDSRVGAQARTTLPALENADGSAGAGAITMVEVDEDLSDTDLVAFDAAGNEIASPAFIVLGHELIHAQHNQRGRNANSLPGSTKAYPNGEEEQTIASGDLTENDLRAEHGVELRHGHRGRDTRNP